MGMPADEIAVIISAIGNHDEKTASPVNPIAAALILADKSDVRRSRVRHLIPDLSLTTIQDAHDRVNYACVKSDVRFSENLKSIILELIIDEKISSIMDYFEIFLTRMTLCRKAAETLNVKFELIINNSRIL
jgi:hypothetical protein